MEVKHVFRDNGMVMGRMISYSKSEYREKNPHSVCYFNANIFTLQEGKIWYGDLDLTKDGESLKRIAEEKGQTLFVLKEMDGRFENEGLLDFATIKKAAVWDTTQEIPFK